MKALGKLKETKGAAAVEFAIILPFLVLLIFGTIEFSLLLFNKQMITNAAREGARAAIVAATPRKQDSDIIAIVENYARNNLITFGDKTTAWTDPTIEPDYDTIRKTAVFGDEVKVTVQYDYDFLVLSNLGFAPVNLEAISVMKME